MFLNAIVMSLTAIVIVALLQQSASAQSTAVDAEPLKGGVEFSDAAMKAPDFTGTWKGHVIEYGRHPSVQITEQNGNEVKGTYSGLLGKFPLTGMFDQTGDTVQLSVDFSKSRLTKWRRRKVAIAVFTGTWRDNAISGTAVIPEFGSKMVHFEAKKSIKEAEITSTRDQNPQ